MHLDGVMSSFSKSETFVLSLIRCIEITQLYNSELLKFTVLTVPNLLKLLLKKKSHRSDGWLIQHRNLFFTVLEAGD